MRTLSISEASSILEVDDLSDFVDSVNWGAADHVESYRIPQESSRQVSLARVLTNMLLDRGRVVLWVRAWGLRGDTEHMDLFERYRLSFGEARTLQDAPVHICEDDHATLMSLLCIALFFGWDFELFCWDGKVVVSASHDDWVQCRVNAEDPIFWSYFQKYIGLKPWPRAPSN